MSDEKLKEIGVERKEYTIPEVKRLKKKSLINLLMIGRGGDQRSNKAQKGKGAYGLSSIIGVDAMTIRGYVYCLLLEPETQKLIDEGEIPYTWASAITRLSREPIDEGEVKYTSRLDQK